MHMQQMSLSAHIEYYILPKASSHEDMCQYHCTIRGCHAQSKLNQLKSNILPTSNTGRVLYHLQVTLEE